MSMPRGTWWGVGPVRRWGVWRKPRTTVGYKQRLGRGFPNNWYPFGCGNSLHHGVDIGGAKGWTRGCPIYAWGDGAVVSGGYDAGGYHRWIQIYYPAANATVTYGHLRNGSQVRIGTRVHRGRYIGRIGTRKEGILNSHLHVRCAWGRWLRCIPPCADVPPIRVWNKLA